MVFNRKGAVKMSAVKSFQGGNHINKKVPAQLAHSPLPIESFLNLQTWHTKYPSSGAASALEFNVSLAGMKSIAFNVSTLCQQRWNTNLNWNETIADYDLLNIYGRRQDSSSVNAIDASFIFDSRKQHEFDNARLINGVSNAVSAQWNRLQEQQATPSMATAAPAAASEPTVDRPPTCPAPPVPNQPAASAPPVATITSSSPACTATPSGSASVSLPTPIAQPLGNQLASAIQFLWSSYMSFLPRKLSRAQTSEHSYF